MQLPSLFRTYKNRQFTYIPRFYNPEKEEREERRRRLGLDGSGGLMAREYHKGIIRGSFRESSAARKKASRASSLRMVLILIILIMVVLYLFSK